QTLSLTCTVSGFSLDSYTINWVRQAPGEALECLGGISSRGAVGYSPGLKSRLSITKDNSKSQVSLSVSSVTPEDTATYYCAASLDAYGCLWRPYVYSPYFHTWGQGLLVTVASASTTAPK
nr:immunoglobulin gamma heavy chain [Bos taurus]